MLGAVGGERDALLADRILELVGQEGVRLRAQVGIVGADLALDEAPARAVVVVWHRFVATRGRAPGPWDVRRPTRVLAAGGN
jgi:hypothetical protein